MAVLNEDENTGYKKNAPAERMPAMSKRRNMAENTILATPTSFGEFLGVFFEVVFFGKLAIFCLPNSFL